MAASAQNNDAARANDATIKLNAYNTRWVEVGAECIKKLIARAKQKRKNTWNARFPNLETLCRDYEKYWFRANLYADKLGIPRQENDKEWLENALNLDISWKRNSILETGRESLREFRKDIREFCGEGSDLLVDRSLMRFTPGETFSLSPPLDTYNPEDILVVPQPDRRFWGDWDQR